MSELDPGLWVRLTDSAQTDGNLRWFILGNAHTHRSRFSVVSLEINESRTVDVRDVSDASPDARRWMDGFMAGQEPSLFEFLGYADDLYHDYTDDDEKRWRDACRRFRDGGLAASITARMPPDDPILSTVTDPPVWTIVGGLFRVWDGSAWAVAEPQPAGEADARWAWPGSVCERRRHCNAYDLHDRYRICADCHQYDGEA